MKRWTAARLAESRERSKWFNAAHEFALYIGSLAKGEAMPIYARKPKSTFKPAPEGLFQAVCVDVWEPFEAEDHFNAGRTVTQTRIVWQLEEIDVEAGRPYEVSQLYRLSLHEKAKLCQHLEAWRGKKFTDKEKDGFDIETLIGVNCQIQVVHNVKEDGSVYANVQAIVPIGKGQTKLRVADGYKRKKDRVETVAEPTDTAVADADGLPL